MVIYNLQFKSLELLIKSDKQTLRHQWDYQNPSSTQRSWGKIREVHLIPGGQNKFKWVNIQSRRALLIMNGGFSECLAAYYHRSFSVKRWNAMNLNLDTA